MSCKLTDTLKLQRIPLTKLLTVPRLSRLYYGVKYDLYI